LLCKYILNCDKLVRILHFKHLYNYMNYHYCCYRYYVVYNETEWYMHLLSGPRRQNPPAPPVIETRIYSEFRTTLLIMIGRTSDRRAGLIPHLSTSELILSLPAYLSWVNWFLTPNKFEYLIFAIIIFLLCFQILSESNPMETNEVGDISVLQQLLFFPLVLVGPRRSMEWTVCLRTEAERILMSPRGGVNRRFLKITT
jgi:hypothetical protein